MAKEYLLKIGWPLKDMEHVSKCISSHRFRGNNAPETVEAKILFDAEKLDDVASYIVSPNCVATSNCQ